MHPFEIRTTKEKGRVLVAARDFTAGEIVLVDKPVIFSSWNDISCIGCNEVHDFPSNQCKYCVEQFPPQLLQRIRVIETELADIDYIDDLDKARNLLKLICIYLGQESTTIDPNKHSLANLAQCQNAISEASNLFQNTELHQFFLENSTKTLFAKYLSMLNTNCHTLEKVEGSGFFSTACLFEHACVPNCNYSSDNFGTLHVVTLTRIKTGDFLSLDYIESFYKPIPIRQEILLRDYGFFCACLSCQEPDYCRAFVCAQCEADCFVVEGKAIKCVCGFDGQVIYYEECAADEDKLIDKASELESLEDLARFRSETKLRLSDRHHLIFEARNELIHYMIDNINHYRPERQQKIYNALCDLITTVEITLERKRYQNCNELVIFYDEAAQLSVRLQKHEEATAWYTKAYLLSKTTSGDEKHSKHTADLCKLAKNTPKNVQNLQSKYN